MKQIKLRIGYAQDSLAYATYKYEIRDETLSGQFVAIRAPRVETGHWRHKYLSYDVSANEFRIPKDQIINPHDEVFEVDE